MFKTILATATAALIATAIGAPAQAQIRPNGLTLQGVEMNGGTWNGQRFHGATIESQGFALDGIALPASVR
ncbi:hypothetical protein LJ725_15115 [Reyranella aquatilis]|uniref:Uncharacterized protein n=1 Tax=Reyranella aquatilis TaxID=2035356 RepID=A0ABS8KW95_9HYPH|nr:hypothetical protein [Reyranella aquatilis]MCC8430304.1 hypothetical protein [Reyranella aquatilis]